MLYLVTLSVVFLFIVNLLMLIHAPLSNGCPHISTFCKGYDDYGFEATEPRNKNGGVEPYRDTPMTGKTANTAVGRKNREARTGYVYVCECGGGEMLKPGFCGMIWGCRC